MSLQEKEIEAAFGRMVKRHGGLSLKWVCPGRRGVPDRIVILPGARIMFVELKRPKNGKISALQKWWRKKLIDFGFWFFIVNDHEAIARVEEIIISGKGSWTDEQF